MRTKKAIINFITDALPQVLILILSFLKIKIFLQYFGEEKLGLYQLYGQLVSYLVLVEGGVGSAMLFRLYKPIHDKDYEKIDEIMAAGRVIFNFVALIILIIGIALAFNIGFFINQNSFSNIYLVVTFVLYLLGQVLIYFVVPYRCLFDAYQDRYIPNLIYQSITLIKAVIEIILVIIGKDLISILVSLVICGFISNGLIIIVFKRKYSRVKFNGKKDFSMLKDVKHLFVNTFAILISNNIDIVLISRFINLKTVAVYSAYNYFVEAIKQMVDKISGATLSGIGDILVDDNSNKICIFNEFNDLVFFLASVICIPLFIFINGFIDLWYEGKFYTTVLYSLLFSLLLYLNIIRIPVKVFSLSSGKFVEVKKFVILEIIINLSLSLILISPFGIAGVLIATIVSIFISDFIFKVNVVFKNIIKESSFSYYKHFLINLLFLLVVNVILYNCISLNTDSLIVYILLAGVVSIINLFICIIFFNLTGQLRFKYRFRKFNLWKKSKEQAS